MTSERKRNLLAKLKLEIKRVKDSADKADEASKFILTGPSQSGDKYHADNAAELAKAYLKRLEKLVEEIEGAKEEILKTAEPVSYVEIEYEDRSRLSFILVKNAISLPGQVFISIKSPLGVSIMGKSRGDNFTYELTNEGNNKVFTGRIVKVE